MPQTALNVKGKNVVIITTPLEEGGFLINMHNADDKYIPVSAVSHYEAKDISEEEWHRGLRLSAGEDFVPSYSTNPEWNKPKENV